MSMNAWRLEEIVVGIYGKMRSLDTRIVMVRYKSWNELISDAVDPISGDFYHLWKSEGTFDTVKTNLKFNGSKIFINRELTIDEVVIVKAAKDNYKLFTKSIRDRVEFISSRGVLDVVKALGIANFIYEEV